MMAHTPIQISWRAWTTLALVAALLCLSLPAPDAQAQMEADFVVEVNKSRVIRLPGNAAVVAIADPDIADVDVMAPNLIAVQGRSAGQTSVMAFNAAGDEILNDTVTVHHNTGGLMRILQRVLPEAEVHFDSVDGAIVATGTVASPLEADRVRQLVEPMLAEGDRFVNMLTVEGSDQVLLKVRVAEVSRSELKRFGINLYSVISNGGQFAFSLVSGRDILPDADDIIPRAGSNNIAANLRSGDVDINSVIDALADDNVIKVLAEPNLTTSSGHTANFLAGGEYPIPVPGQDGQVTIDYRQYGVALQFTPHVLSKEKISLTVAPEVSELSDIGAVELNGFNVPALTTRRAETTVELGSGQSFAIAGLLQNGNSTNISKFPGLGDIPILGALFRSSEFQNDQTELVILVTPYIVRGVPRGELTDPTEGFIPPTDPERVLDGHTYTPDETAATKSDANRYMLEGSPRDLRRPKFRRTLARQAAGHVQPREETMTPAPPVSKNTPVEKVNSKPLAAPPAPPETPSPEATRPATLNGSVGYRLE